MTNQKFIFKSKTIVSALLTLLLAIIPQLIEGVENDFPLEQVILIVATVLSTSGTILGRYHAQGEIYTPDKLPGRSYRPVRDME